jgi:hypothetical protein
MYCCWPGLQEVHEIIHRVERLSDMVGGTAAAAHLLSSHPQLLTRPPAALEQQLLNLAAWLRLPFAQGTPGAASSCQDLMDLVITNPGVLFLSKVQVTGQLEAMQQLLQLPSLEQLLEEEVAVCQQLLLDAHHMQQQHQHEVTAGAAIAGSSSSSSSSSSSQGLVPAADYQWLMDEQAQKQEQREQQIQQMKKALKAWRKAAQQQQQGAASPPQAAAAAGGAAGGGELPWKHWPGRLICHAPEWLFVDPHATMPRRVDYLSRLLFGSSIIKSTVGSGSSSSSSISTMRKVSALLLDAPQLIGVNPLSVPGKLRTLHKLLQQHPSFAVQQQHQQQQQSEGALSVQRSSKIQPKPGKGRKQGQQPQEFGHVVPLLLQSPLLLVQPAKQLEQHGAELLQRLPGLPLYHLLLLLPQQELHWQQLEFLQHLQLLPAASSQQASAATVQTPVAAAASAKATSHLYNSSSRSSSTQQQSSKQHSAASSTAWTDAHLQLATEALSLQPSLFTSRYPQYPAWQAAVAAAQQSSRDWRSGWGWPQELQQQLSGPACQDWLQQLNGKWQRLLLLAAGEHWLQEQPRAAAAAAAAAVGPAGSKQRRRSSRMTSSRRDPAASAAAAAAGQGDGTGLSGVSLRQVAALAGNEFPYRPAAAAGPLPWDLPQLTIQQLLSSSRAALDNELGMLAGIWRQLVAAAGGCEKWQQQLGNAACLLPQALMAAGWKLPAGVSKALASSSESSSTSSWIEDSMESRASVGIQPAAAAAAQAVRQQFWQHLQQPGVLSQLCSRLQFIQQTGPRHHQLPSSSSSSSSIEFSNIWSVLAASDTAFLAACPEFATWQQLHNIVSDKRCWADELASLQGQQLLAWLQQAAAGWWRLAYLASDAGEGMIWQAISMSDALAASDEAFTDMFPEARYGSWQVLAQLRGDEGATTTSSSSSSSAALRPPQDQQGHAAQGGEAAAKPASSSSSPAAARSPKPKADTAAQRLQLLQDYASLHPSWEAELQGWRKETWATAARTFVPLKARRLEFVLQMLEPSTTDGFSHTSDSSGNEVDSTAADTLTSSRDLEVLGTSAAAAAAAAAMPYVPDLQFLATAANVHFAKRFPLFTTWHEVGSAVQAVPRWSAEWHAVRGAALAQLLQQIQQLQVPDAAAARQQAFEQHSELLRSKLAGMQLQQGAEGVGADTLQLPGVGRSSLLRNFSLTRLGVTNLPASSSSSLAAEDGDTADAAGAGHGGKKTSKVYLAVKAAERSSRRYQPPGQLQGLELALHRLTYFSSGTRAANAVRDVPLQQLLVMPQVQLLDIAQALDPALAAAKAQGCADAESRFLEEVYPWLGLKALSPEVQQGLSPKGVRLLEERLDDLLLLQQVAHTWPAWEQQLQGYGAAVLEQMVRRVAACSERLHVMVR